MTVGSSSAPADSSYNSTKGGMYGSSHTVSQSYSRTEISVIQLHEYTQAENIAAAMNTVMWIAQCHVRWGDRQMGNAILCRNQVRWLALFIEASLSEPHTSETALHTCIHMYMLVCLQPYTVNFK